MQTRIYRFVEPHFDTCISALSESVIIGVLRIKTLNIFSNRSALHGGCWWVPADAQRLPKWWHMPQHLWELPVCVCEWLDWWWLQREHWWLCQCCVPPRIHLSWPCCFFLLWMPPRPNRYLNVYIDFQELLPTTFQVRVETFWSNYFECFIVFMSVATQKWF